MKPKYRITLFAITALPIMLAALAQPLWAQAEPEVPEDESVLRPEPQKNGWQIGFYGGISMNEYYEGYDIANTIDFLADETSWNVPFGASLNIPIYNELSLYVRAGVQNMTTNFFNGREDSLKSAPGIGEIGFDMDFTFNIFHVDLMIRLIGDNEGERVYFGPSFGFVSEKHIVVRREELRYGYIEELQDQEMPGADDFFPTFVVGAEYAIVPLKNLYLIPAIEVNFGWEKVSSLQRLRATYYRLLFNVSYQFY